ncbi:MAG: Protein GrpE [Anaerolineales bacterium]|nr:Protein GrpE [Anaerolineales bacterium]WKZ46091.1 MAG: nucleotide exchange factor GrpE [Anaerolineales bacterium]
MTHKKNHKHETHEIKIEAEEMPEMDEQVEVDVEALKRQLEDAESKLAESVEGWQRSQADFQNYRKRVERDNEMTFASMKGDIVKKILPVLDDLERALNNRPADDAWANGIELIARKFQNILDVEGIKRIEAAGAEFDPKFHEAISHEHNEDFESGQVIEVVQNGYMLGERVIRPALVRVAQ